MIQMLGRKRREPAERINLYVCDLSKSKHTKRMNAGEVLLNYLSAYEEMDMAGRRKWTRELWNIATPSIRKYFLLAGATVRPNRLAFHELKRRMKLYKSLEDPETDFRRVVYAWLDKSPLLMDEDNPISQFCEARLGSHLTSEEVGELRQLLLDEVDRQIRLGRNISRSRKDRNDKYGALNGMLEKVGCSYQLTKNYQIIPYNKEE